MLIADGKQIPISSVKLGEKIKAVNTVTGKEDTQTVEAVMVKHDTDLYDLTVATAHGKTVVHTTSDHLFWDKTTGKWVKAASLHAGDHLLTDDGSLATAAGGTTPHDPTGWMGDLTVSNDHDFYVVASSGSAVLVHNDSCTLTFTHGTTTEDANNIAEIGLNGDAAQAASHGGVFDKPGSLYTYQIDGPTDPNFVKAAQ